MAEEEKTSSDWLSMFDDLTGLPRARLAVFVFMLLSAIAFLSSVALALSAYDLALTYFPSLGTVLSVTRFGATFKADLGGLILTALVCFFCVQTIPVIGKIAVWVGGKTKIVSK
ncbi:hypothetical protein [Candidatus Phycosocius spiralis]|uniref:Uncharacterized protein n=1 Tax=Candidatus Phycosocius spiralis TaxID=2815099 RepID=A0ABQ4PWA4_9PROT|nr:hypothetical protein [Candidatus Phycosocius spiralis]GIU67288.1 hypothetical protein PsB1_1442 [Candidatus Phycosocius spiralis]